MSQKCFPLLYVNLAGEMLYILDQRLKVVISDFQEEGKRGPRVIKDLIRNIFLKERLEGIMRPGGIPGKKEMRLLFDKLAHCSVMKLTSNSMNKLFDLMVMHCKYEFLMIDWPQQILTVTMNHLAGMRELCKDQPESLQVIDQCHAMVYTLYRATPTWEWVQIRNSLLQFFMHANVKVSLMIRSGRQTEDGHFILRAPEEKVKITLSQILPGKTSYYENGALTHTTDFPVQREYTYVENTKDNFNIETDEARSTTLGGNMYLGAGRDSLKVGSGGVAENDHLPPGNEVKLFEQIFGNISQPTTGSPPPSYDSIMDVNMFDDDKEEKKYEKDLKVLRIDAAKGKKSLNTAMAEMKLGTEEKPKKAKASKGIDMLDLMDEAAARPPTAKKSVGGSVRSRPASKEPRTSTRPPSQGPAGGARERSASTKARSTASRTPSTGVKPATRTGSRAESATRKQ